MKKVVIAGGSGFLGGILSKHFSEKGIQVVVLSRFHQVDEELVRYVKWDVNSPGYWCAELEGSDALINLAGKSVDCRYTKANKQAIYDSRLSSTHILGKVISQCQDPPRVWVNASSATIYRHSEDRDMDENDGELGDGFSVDVCKKWEQMFFHSETPRTRKVALRIAIVLGREGGALEPLSLLSRFGIGGAHGSGHQYFSWIDERDFLRAVDFLLVREKSSGVYNLSSPNPISNRAFMKILRKSLNVWFGLPIPRALLTFGAFLIGTETELLLKSRRVVSSRLLSEGFSFRFTHLSDSLKTLNS